MKKIHAAKTTVFISKIKVVVLAARIKKVKIWCLQWAGTCYFIYVTLCKLLLRYPWTTYAMFIIHAARTITFIFKINVVVFAAWIIVILAMSRLSMWSICLIVTDSVHQQQILRCVAGHDHTRHLRITTRHMM